MVSVATRAYSSSVSTYGTVSRCKVPGVPLEELGPRLAKASLWPGVLVQMASDGDDVTDSSAVWPDNRPEIAFGTITLTGQVDDREPERRKIIFDPIPRVDDIDASGDRSARGARRSICSADAGDGPPTRSRSLKPRKIFSVARQAPRTAAVFWTNDSLMRAMP
jgi:hypothetical protein